MCTRLAPLALLVGLVVDSPAFAQPRENPPPLALVPKNPAPLAVVPTDSFAFITVNAGKLWDTPDFKPLRDWFAAQKVGPTDEMLGLPAADLDRVTLFMPTATPNTPALLLVTTKKPYNEAKLVKALGADRPGAKGVERPSGNVITCSGPAFSFAVFVDERTVLYVPNSGNDASALAAVLGQVLAKKADGPLATALADAGKHDIALALDTRPLAGMVGTFFDARTAAPYLALLKARTATFAADFDKTARGSLKLTFANADDAKRAAPVLKEGITELSVGLEKELERKGRQDGFEKAIWATALTVLKAAKVEAIGADVFATADMPYQDAVTKLVAAMPASYTASVNSVKGQNNLKQLALGAFNYESAYGVFPGDMYPGGQKLAWSWRVQILPFLEQENLYRQVDFTKSWDDPANLKKLEAMEMPKVFEIPGRPAPKGHTYYRIFSLPKDAKGTDRPWLKEGERGPPITSITDGTSNTLMIVEAGEAVPWYKPDVLAYDGKLPLPQLGDKDADRFIAAMGDGSVRVLRPSKLGEKTLRALITIAGGEVINLP